MIGNRSRSTSSYGLSRDLKLLEVLASEEAQGSGGLGVLRVAELAGREKSQVSRALRALSEADLVERDPESRRYRIGWRLFTLLAQTSEAQLLHAAPRYMSDLVRRLDETAHLCVLKGPEILTLISESPQHGFRATGWVGKTVPAYCTSAGWVLLMNEEREDLEKRFAQVNFDIGGPGSTVDSMDTLCAHVQRVRACGYALSDEGFEPGLVGTAAPVRNRSGRIIAALNISAKKTRLGQRFELAGKETAAVADELSAALGWRSGSLWMEKPT